MRCVCLHDGPLPHAAVWKVDGAGAVVCFEGMVRPQEAGQQIEGLCYETYDPMARQELEHLADRTAADFSLLSIFVEHSRGFVPAHACSFRLRVAAAHRRAALDAMDQFIDVMKRDVPIWKTPLFAGAVCPGGDR